MTAKHSLACSCNRNCYSDGFACVRHAWSLLPQSKLPYLSYHHRRCKSIKVPLPENALARLPQAQILNPNLSRGMRNSGMETARSYSLRPTSNFAYTADLWKSTPQSSETCYPSRSLLNTARPTLSLTQVRIVSRGRWSVSQTHRMTSDTS